MTLSGRSVEDIVAQARYELSIEEHQRAVAQAKARIIEERNKPRLQWPFRWVGFYRRPHNAG